MVAAAVAVAVAPSRDFRYPAAHGRRAADDGPPGYARFRHRQRARAAPRPLPVRSACRQRGVGGRGRHCGRAARTRCKDGRVRVCACARVCVRVGARHSARLPRSQRITGRPYEGRAHAWAQGQRPFHRTLAILYAIFSMPARTARR